uniref:DH domain-containing protein n=1 Tax=Rhabditophanes sp. KR3021 TaxID=114890 RepID=A0AC35TRW8_9BILA
MNPRNLQENNDADDSDSDNNDLTKHYRRRPSKRSSTSSPSSRNRSSKYYYRRRSDVLNYSEQQMARRRSGGERSGGDRTSKSFGKGDGRLRKTNSEPNVEHGDDDKMNMIRQLLNSLAIPSLKHHSSSAYDIWKTPRESLVPDEYVSMTEDEFVSTQIEELKDAAQSIQSLQRCLKIPNSRSTDLANSLANIDANLSNEENSEIKKFVQDQMSTLSPITTHFGVHPRGVMQYLPSVRANQFSPLMDTYRFNRAGAKLSLDSTVSSSFEPYENDRSYGYTFSGRDYGKNEDSISLNNSSMAMNNVKIIRTNEEGEMFQSTHTDGGDSIESDKGANSIASVSRFSKLINSFKSSEHFNKESTADYDDWSNDSRRTSNATNYETGSVGPTSYPVNYSNTLKPVSAKQYPPPNLDQTLLQADMILWKKRSRASLRRHQDVRKLAIRELFETEKSYVELLDYMVQKFMRPLKQPLECTLIEFDAVNKIFYKLPEILAHHQVLLAALYSRMETTTDGDYVIADVLLAHFKKISMIDTYIAFVDNFKAAKQAISEARQKQAFEKYYMRCCREHHSKLDLDSLIILPIQRVPRYELLLKQIIKHTPVEHSEYEKLLCVKHYIRELALKINKQREDNEHMEQRLREIEAIVDGLNDLVSSSRIFLRYDLVAISNQSSDRKARCIFMMSDQLIVTSVRRKPGSNNNYHYGKNIKSFFNAQSPDFLNQNRFKLLMKISLSDVEVGKDTLPLLQGVKKELKVVQEDCSILNKMIDLSKLLGSTNQDLATILEDNYLDKIRKQKGLEERMSIDANLTSVDLNVVTFNGIENLNIQFSNADKRSIWESNLTDSKHALKNSANCQQHPPEFRSMIPLRLRPGLEINVGTSTFGRSAEGASNVWVCSSDKFSGQLQILNVNGEPTVESSTFIGNSAIVSIIAVPVPKVRSKNSKKVYPPSSLQSPSELLLDSSSSETDLNDSEQSSTSMATQQSTIWIGNEDGEIFVYNYHDNIKIKSKDKMTKLQIPIVAMAYVDDVVFISLSSKHQNQLIYFKRKKDLSWDMLEKKVVKNITNAKIDTMTAVTNRLCFSSENYIYLLNTLTLTIEKKVEVGCNICSIGHAGPSKFLTCVNATTYNTLTSTTKSRRMSLNASLLQQMEQMFVISGGQGIDHFNPSAAETTNDPSNANIGTDDAVNHLLFWKI